MASSSSLAGTWGAQKRGAEIDTEKYKTTAERNFGLSHIQKYKQDSAHCAAKFRALKASETMILSYANRPAHSGMGEEMDVSSRGSLSSSSSASTTLSAPLPEETKQLTMNRTMSKLLKTKDAPIAVGRSGIRKEKGINASGLLGERLQTETEPTRNSFVQRSWLPYDDPALLYKVNGIPEAFMPNDVSFPIGEGGGHVEVGLVHQRKAVFTGDPLSKSGALRAGVFTDDYPFNGRKGE